MAVFGRQAAIEFGQARTADAGQSETVAGDRATDQVSSPLDYPSYSTSKTLFLYVFVRMAYGGILSVTHVHYERPMGATDSDGVAAGFQRGHPFGHHMFEKKRAAIFVEHMQRASAGPRFKRWTRYRHTSTPVLMHSESRWFDSTQIELFGNWYGCTMDALWTGSLDMPQPDLQSRLQALARDAQSRSKTARLRDVFEHVEAALQAGVSRSDVLNELNRDGFDMTLASFKSALQRIRNDSSGRSPVVRSQSNEPKENPGNDARNSKDGTAKVSTRHTEAVSLPEDWMSATLTPAQNRLLTPAQRRARTDAKAAPFFPNRFKPESSKP
jgi:hypothetical protein